MHLPAGSDGAGSSVLICVPVPVSLGKGYSNFPLITPFASHSKGTTRLLTRPQEGILRSSKTTSLSHSSAGTSKYPSWSAPRRSLPTGVRAPGGRPVTSGRAGKQRLESGLQLRGVGADRSEGRGDMISMAGSTSVGGGQGGTRPGTRTLGPQMGKNYRGASRHDVWPSAPPVPTP